MSAPTLLKNTAAMVEVYDPHCITSPPVRFRIYTGTYTVPGNTLAYRAGPRTVLVQQDEYLGYSAIFNRNNSGLYEQCFYIVPTSDMATSQSRVMRLIARFEELATISDLEMIAVEKAVKELRSIGDAMTRATGHNCKMCNDRNDYAEANQPDGSYVCYKCR